MRTQVLHEELLATAERGACLLLGKRDPRHRRNPGGRRAFPGLLDSAQPGLGTILMLAGLGPHGSPIRSLSRASMWSTARLGRLITCVSMGASTPAAGGAMGPDANRAMRDDARNAPGLLLSVRVMASSASRYRASGSEPRLERGSCGQVRRWGFRPSPTRLAPDGWSQHEPPLPASSLDGEGRRTRMHAGDATARP